jgi:hypothetical protein
MPEKSIPQYQSGVDGLGIPYSNQFNQFGVGQTDESLSIWEQMNGLVGGPESTKEYEQRNNVIYEQPEVNPEININYGQNPNDIVNAFKPFGEQTIGQQPSSQQKSNTSSKFKVANTPFTTHSDEVMLGLTGLGFGNEMLQRSINDKNQRKLQANQRDFGYNSIPKQYNPLNEFQHTKYYAQDGGEVPQEEVDFFQETIGRNPFTDIMNPNQNATEDPANDETNNQQDFQQDFSSSDVGSNNDILKTYLVHQQGNEGARQIMSGSISDQVASNMNNNLPKFLRTNDKNTLRNNFLNYWNNKTSEPVKNIDEETKSSIIKAAKESGENPNTWLKIAEIESSGGKAKDRKGSNYKGLFQIDKNYMDNQDDLTDPYMATKAAIAHGKGKFDNRGKLKYQDGEMINNTGYTPGYDTMNNPYNIIPSSDITMQKTPFPVLGIDNLGNQQIMYPGNDYKFKGSHVLEIPQYQNGGIQKNPEGWWQHRDPKMDSNLENNAEYIPVAGTILGVNDWMSSVQDFYDKPSISTASRTALETLSIVPFGKLAKPIGKFTKETVGLGIDTAINFLTDERVLPNKGTMSDANKLKQQKSQVKAESTKVNRKFQDGTTRQDSLNVINSSNKAKDFYTSQNYQQEKLPIFDLFGNMNNKDAKTILNIRDTNDGIINPNTPGFILNKNIQPNGYTRFTNQETADIAVVPNYGFDSNLKPFETKSIPEFVYKGKSISKEKYNELTQGKKVDTINTGRFVDASKYKIKQFKDGGQIDLTNFDINKYGK